MSVGDSRAVFAGFVGGRATRYDYRETGDDGNPVWTFMVEDRPTVVWDGLQLSVGAREHTLASPGVVYFDHEGRPQAMSSGR